MHKIEYTLKYFNKHKSPYVNNYEQANISRLSTQHKNHLKKCIVRPVCSEMSYDYMGL